MSERIAIQVACRILGIWLAVNALRGAMLGFYLGVTAPRGSYESIPFMTQGFSRATLDLGVAIMLWFSAPYLARMGRDSAVLGGSAPDITNALLRALGVYFIVSGIADLLFYFAQRGAEPNAYLALVSRQAEPIRPSVFIVCGILLFIGSDRIKKFIASAARYGLEETPVEEQ